MYIYIASIIVYGIKPIMRNILTVWVQYKQFISHFRFVVLCDIWIVGNEIM